ncbi:hypothetical protein [Streptomyces sp. NPDC088725]|uniref:hypothetical protein n=1 Tax=Streptomyces sp. NPDC088725 TaxID=3365873 RepID=UPI00382113EF
MKDSKARRFLSRLTEEFGSDGVLIVQKSELAADGADLVPGSALRWPPCECGHSLCPDYKEPEDESAHDVLSELVAERNKLSRKSRP